MGQGGRKSKFKSRTQSHASNAIVKLSMLKWIWQVQTNLYIDKGQLCGMGRKQRLFFPFKESTVLRMIMGPKRVLWLSVWAGEGGTVPPKACCKGAMFSG